MHDRRLTLHQSRAGLAILASLLLLMGAAWTGIAADGVWPGTGAEPKASAAAVSAPIAHSIAGGRDSYADIVKVVGPAVVTVRTEGKARMAPTDFQGDDFLRRFFGDQFDGGPRSPRVPRSFKQRGLGSGVIVSGDGYILTNNHVVDNADVVKVELTDGRTLMAKVVGTDKPTDLAVLKITASDLQPLALGNSDGVQVGDVVLAVGNPLGIGQTVTMGIISAKGRSTSVGDSYEDFLQTDAPINHGNSGGALVNTKGELVGINSQILSTSDGNIGIGFAIPANMARRVMDDLRQGGKVRRSQLGVTVQAVTPEIASTLGLKQTGGAIVSSVAPGSAAERAGVKRGDVIESFNGQPVRDTNTLRNRVAEAGPGSTASLVIVRDGSEKTLTVKLDEKSTPQGEDRNGESDPEANRSALGITAAPLTPEVAARVGAPKGTKGVVVENVNPDGRAADAGIQAGDVIMEVNRKPVQSVEELRDAVKNAGNKPVLLLINRQGNDLFVAVPANG